MRPPLTTDVGREAIPAGLVVRDAPLIAGPPLEQVHDSVHARAVRQHRVLPLAGVVSPEAAGETDADLHASGRPVRAVGREAAHPVVDVSADRPDGVLPDAQDGRPQAVLVLTGHPRREFVGHGLCLLEARVGQGRPAPRDEGAHDGREHLVDHRPARQRVERRVGHGLLARLEAQDGREVELIRARGEPLERRRRVGPGLQAVPRQDLRRYDEAIVRRPGARQALMPRDERASEGRVEVEQVARAAVDVGLGAAQVSLQHAEVVLGGVDGAGRVVRRGPREPRAAALLCRPHEHLVAGHSPRDSALHVDGVEGRHARSRLCGLHRGVRGHQCLRGGPDGEAQLEAFAGDANLVGREVGRQTRPFAIQQQGILPAALREHAFGQAEHTHDLEGASAKLVGRADEHTPVPVRRRRNRQVRQPVAQHVADLGEVHAGDTRQGLQFGQGGDHAVGAGDHARRQAMQACEPAAPVVHRGPRRHLADDVACERDQFVGPRPLACEELVAGRTRILLERCVGAHLQVLAMTAQPPLPAVGPADHLRVVEDGFPPPRRTPGRGAIDGSPSIGISIGARGVVRAGVRRFRPVRHAESQRLRLVGKRGR